MNYRLFLSSLFICCASTGIPALAVEGYEELSIHTQNGCKAKMLIQAQEAPFVRQAEYVWDGLCLNGFIEGPGHIKIQKTLTTTDLQIKAHNGSAFGFMKVLNELETLYQFQWNGRIVGYSDLGFEKDESLLRVVGRMPTRIKFPITFDPPNLSVRAYFTDGLSGTVVLTKINCAVDKENFSDCPPGGYNVFKFLSFSPIGSKSPMIEYCTDPKKLQSCQSPPPLLELLVSQSEGFIRSSMPAVIDMDREMQAFIKPQLENLRRQTEVQEKAKAADASAFQQKLDKAPVGELFAMADEFKVKGDNAKARQALRSLLSRFSDHKLAIPSASMLSELQGK